MKKLLLSTSAALALSGSAFAADLPSRKAAPVYAPPPPVSTWTGFYVGLNAGGTWSESNTTIVGSGPFYLNPGYQNAALHSAYYNALSNGTLPGSSNGGFIGGGQIGYNWQWGNSIVMGVEADIQGVTTGSTGNSGAAALAVTNGPVISSSVSASRGMDYLGTVRGRLGYAITPTLLLFGSGGLAYGGVNSSVAISQGVNSNILGAALGSGQFSDTRVGWTAGGGAEWMFMPNWSAKVEYLYYDLGSVTYNVSALSPVIGTNPNAGQIAFANAAQASTRFNGHIVRAGVNYHFNWGSAPVVAKF